MARQTQSAMTTYILMALVVVLGIAAFALVLTNDRSAEFAVTDAPSFASQPRETATPLPTPETIALPAQTVSGTPEEICRASLPAQDPATREYVQAANVIEVGVDYRAIFCTEAGPIYIDLLEDQAPETVNNLVFLASQGFYNNTTFHRVLEDFMAQGGDPTASGSGGPGYRFDDEIAPYLTFEGPGLLAMANAGPGTNGSQFFITTSSPTYLNGQHTIFGRVLEGYENALALKLRDPQQNPDFEGSRLDTIVIITDPSQVTTSYEDPAPATEADLQDRFDTVVARWTTELLDLDAEKSGARTAESIVAETPADLQAAMTDFLDAHNFQYGYRQRLLNRDCNPQIVFSWIQYTVDAYATPEDAAQALADGLLYRVAEAEGFTEEGRYERTLYPVFSQEGGGCDERPSHTGRAFFKHGRYVVTTEVAYPDDVVPDDATHREAVFLLSRQIILNVVWEPDLGTIYAQELGIAYTAPPLETEATPEATALDEEATPEATAEPEAEATEAPSATPTTRPSATPRPSPTPEATPEATEAGG